MVFGGPVDGANENDFCSLQDSRRFLGALLGGDISLTRIFKVLARKILLPYQGETGLHSKVSG